MEVIGVSQGGQMPLDLDVNMTDSVTVKPLHNLGNQIARNLKDSGNNDFKSLKDAADQANKIMEETRTHLKFEVYGKFNDIVVQVLDDNTNEVVKEVPPKKLIDMVEKFCEMSGFFMDEKV